MYVCMYVYAICFSNFDVRCVYVYPLFLCVEKKQLLRPDSVIFCIDGDVTGCCYLESVNDIHGYREYSLCLSLGPSWRLQEKAPGQVSPVS